MIAYENKVLLFHLYFFQSQLYMMEQSKRSMELQVSQIRSHKNMLEKSNAELQALYKLEKEKRRKLRDKIKLLKVSDIII